jgi:hypothetical protein
MSPEVAVGEGLRENVGGLLFRLFVDQRYFWLRKALVQPRHIHTVGSAQMPHGGVTARFTHTDHGLVVLVKGYVGLSGQEGVPQLKGRKANQP